MMQKKIKNLRLILPIFVGGICLLSFSAHDADTTQAFPYERAGLTKREAAAHLLDRFTFGAGQVDEVVDMGIEKWFAGQLDADLPNPGLDSMLEGYRTLAMSNEEIVATFPKPAQLIRMAIRDGAIEKDEVNKEQKKETRTALAA
jgi:hypothetical protein